MDAGLSSLIIPAASFILLLLWLTAIIRTRDDKNTNALMCLSEAAKRQMRTCTQPRLSLSLMQTLKDGYMHTRWVSVQLSLNMLLLYKDKEEVYLHAQLTK